jgi:endonuclease/exonuclease/phosphatase family metal-dependent hydrolase
VRQRPSEEVFGQSIEGHINPRAANNETEYTRQEMLNFQIENKLIATITFLPSDANPITHAPFNKRLSPSTQDYISVSAKLQGRTGVINNDIGRRYLNSDHVPLLWSATTTCP